MCVAIKKGRGRGKGRYIHRGKESCNGRSLMYTGRKIQE
jgi:hypothetical protein